jgi:hypothetical protein
MHGILILSALSAGLSFTGSQKNDPELQAEVDARIPVVEEWAADPVIVGAVRDANESPRSIREIELADERWQATPGVDDFMRTVIDHAAADRLRELRAENPELQEAFLTDALGANIASTNKTSDFYQGDEAKFRVAFDDGAGAIYTGAIARDESIQSYSAQIGVPVMDDGRAIGVLVVTVNVEKLKRMMDSK